MGAAKKATHRVIHPRLYFGPGPDYLEVGTLLTLNKDKGKAMEARGFVEPLKASKTVDLTGDDDKENDEEK